MYAETILAIIVVISIALCGVLAWMCHSGEERSGCSHISSNLFYLPMDNGSQGHNNLSFMQDSSTVCVVSIPTTLSIQPAKIHCTPRPIFVQD